MKFDGWERSGVPEMGRFHFPKFLEMFIGFGLSFPFSGGGGTKRVALGAIGICSIPTMVTCPTTGVLSVTSLNQMIRPK